VGRAEVVDRDVVVDHVRRIVAGIDAGVMVGEDDADSPVPLGEGSRDPVHRLRAGHVEGHPP
jgi:hypothetical protein